MYQGIHYQVPNWWCNFPPPAYAMSCCTLLPVFISRRFQRVLRTTSCPEWPRGFLFANTSMAAAHD